MTGSGVFAILGDVFPAVPQVRQMVREGRQKSPPDEFPGLLRHFWIFHRLLVFGDAQRLTLLENSQGLRISTKRGRASERVNETYPRTGTTGGITSRLDDKHSQLRSIPCMVGADALKSRINGIRGEFVNRPGVCLDSGYLSAQQGVASLYGFSSDSHVMRS